MLACSLLACSLACCIAGLLAYLLLVGGQADRLADRLPSDGPDAVGGSWSWNGCYVTTVVAIFGASVSALLPLLLLLPAQLSLSPL